MKWNALTSISQWDEIIENSQSKPQVIFKHSTRCSISSMALSRFEMSGILENSDFDFHFLDLIQFREVSNFVASDTGVVHQSPQLIVLSDKKAVYDTSHGMINANDLKQFSKN